MRCEFISPLIRKKKKVDLISGVFQLTFRKKERLGSFLLFAFPFLITILNQLIFNPIFILSYYPYHDLYVRITSLMGARHRGQTPPFTPPLQCLIAQL